MTRKSLIVGFTISLIIILIFYTTNIYTTSNQGTIQSTINSAKELKISANELGEGWEESFSYMDNPAKALEEFCKAIESNKERLLKKNSTDEKTFEEKNNLLELSNKLKECNVRDSYILVLKRVKSPKSLVEVDVFVFNEVGGAMEFFKYMKSTAKGWETLKVGNEIAFRSTETPCVLLKRTSNAVVRVIVWDGEVVGMEIMEKILSKVK